MSSGRYRPLIVCNRLGENEPITSLTLYNMIAAEPILRKSTARHIRDFRPTLMSPAPTKHQLQEYRSAVLQAGATGHTRTPEAATYHMTDADSSEQKYVVIKYNMTYCSQIVLLSASPILVY
jgi:hypothetical protein